MTNTASRNAKYQKLAIMLQRQIELGQLDPGQKLPPVRDMAHQMQVTPGTVARAYRVLIDDGYLEAGVGQGTYVKQLRASVLPPDDAPLYLRSPRLPDVGQVDLIRRGVRDFSEHAGFHDMMAYPTRADTTTLQQAYLNWLKYVPLGRCGPEDVVISHGGQQASVAILQFLVSKRDVHAIAVDHLSYPGFRDMASVANAKYSASGIWWATSQGVFSAHLMALVSTGDVMHHVIFFIFYSGISLVLMKVPEALAQRDPEFDTVDLLLPLGAFAVLSLGAAFFDDISRASILSSVVSLCARARVEDHDNPNAPDNHRRFGIGVALFLLIFMG